MNYVVCQNPVVRMDLVVERMYLPQLIGYFERMHCTYEKELNCNDVGNGRSYVMLKDIKGPTGGNIGELLGLFYSLEWGGKDEGGAKFYILLNPRKKGKKKNVCKNRKEVNSGSHSGNSGKPSGNTGSGPVAGPAGDGLNIGPADLDIDGEFPGQPTTCDGRCE